MQQMQSNIHAYLLQALGGDLYIYIYVFVYHVEAELRPSSDAPEVTKRVPRWSLVGVVSWIFTQNKYVLLILSKIVLSFT